MNWLKNISFLLLFGITSVFGQSIDSEFGLTLSRDGCSKEFSAYTNSFLVLGNSYIVEGNKIVLRYHDIQLLKTIFKDANDGIAIDVLEKDQFVCAEQNKLNPSTIFDGKLLKPVYRDELFASNTAKGNYRFIGEIGTIPTELVGKELVFSILIINDGKVCKYLLPAPITVRDYILQPVPFRFENTDSVNLRSSGVSNVEVVKYSFATSKIIPNKSPVVLGKQKIHSITIKAFSSIDGEEKNNAYLDSSRAAFISKDLQNRLKIETTSISKEHGENWRLANYQFRYFGLDSLLGKTRQEVRTAINERELNNIPIDSLLKEQRVCEARIYYEGMYNTTADSLELLKGNLLHAVATRNTRLFNKVAFLLYTSSKESAVIYDQSVFEFALENSEVVAAYSALLSKGISKNQQNIARFISTWSQKQLSVEGKENLVNLYCLFNNSLLQEWDVASSKLARVVRPESLSTATKSLANQGLLLNLNLTFIKYYGQINDTKNAQTCFNFITRHFSGISLEMEAAVELAAYYNSWGVFQQAIDLLGTYYLLDLLNEDGVFLYAETQLLINQTGLTKMDVSSLETALRLNQKRWCKWMNDYHQNLRNSEIKRMYCERCQEK